MLKEEQIFLYKGITFPDNSEEISFEMISEFGFPKMYIDICTNYPLCDNYTYDNIDGLIKPISINSQSTYKLKNIQKYSSTDKNQYVIM